MSNRLNLIDVYKKYAPLGVFLACVALVIAIGENAPSAVLSHTPTDRVQVQTEHNVSQPGDELLPTTLRIPDLGLTADFTNPLGLQSNQEVEVPAEYETVGWYKHSPVPGELGPAVILGHVDSLDGPAVFYALGQLDKGDDIVIGLSDGSEATFKVTGSEKYEQSSFPTSLVYGDIDHAGLRLVTCSGWYDSDTSRYSHNRVVFAKLKVE